MTRPITRSSETGGGLAGGTHLSSNLISSTSTTVTERCAEQIRLFNEDVKNLVQHYPKVISLTNQAGQYRICKRILTFLAIVLIALIILAIVGAATAHGGGALLILPLLGKYVVPIAINAIVCTVAAMVAIKVCRDQETSLFQEAKTEAIFSGDYSNILEIAAIHFKKNIQSPSFTQNDRNALAKDFHRVMLQIQALAKIADEKPLAESADEKPLAESADEKPPAGDCRREDPRGRSPKRRPPRKIAEEKTPSEQAAALLELVKPHLSC